METDTGEGTRDGPPFIVWDDFWARETGGEDWLVPDVLARGRGHSLYARAGTGKSLFALWCILEALDAGAAVMVLDYEMSADDLRERLEAFGRGPGDDLSRLCYWQFPGMAELNTPRGAQQLDDALGVVAARNPGRSVLVVIDTIGRAVKGEENSNDTVLMFARTAGIVMRRREVTWLRIDHAGHEATHARGGSAKGDDVDVIWKIESADGGVTLRAEKRRMGWVPESVVFTLRQDPVLVYERKVGGWPLGTLETAQELDELGVGSDAAVRVASAALRDAGRSRRTTIVGAAQRWRRMRPDSGNVIDSRESENRETRRETLGNTHSRGPGNGLGNTGKRTLENTLNAGDNGRETERETLGNTDGSVVGNTGNPPFRGGPFSAVAGNGFEEEFPF